MLNQRKYDGMYYRVGVIVDDDSEMEWMEPDYDTRTLREIIETGNSKTVVENLLDIMLIDTPNIETLSHSLGDFVDSDRCLKSKHAYNQCIENIEIFPFQSRSFDTETQKIVVKFKANTFKKAELLGILSQFSTDISNQNICIGKVENSLVNFNANLHLEISYFGDHVDHIELNYKELR